VNALICKPSFAIKSGLATHARCTDRLAIMLIGHITSCKYSRDIGVA
jgi:hypothetical protein